MTERSLGRALIRWYRRNRRDLPWRRTNDPYAIWISEVMLQQTTVPTIAPRWQRFLHRFPTVGALAQAPEREVLAEWAGLGYYARARNLCRAAKRIVSAGAFPRTAVEWRALPGVGPYTAAAIASICFGEPAAVVDGNVARVLSRLEALRLDPRSPAGSRRLRSAAQALLDHGAPGEFNQALMELGATVCTPRAPRCPDCPLGASCRARTAGDARGLSHSEEAKGPSTDSPRGRRRAQARANRSRRGRGNGPWPPDRASFPRPGRATVCNGSSKGMGKRRRPSGRCARAAGKAAAFGAGPALSGGCLHTRRRNGVPLAPLSAENASPRGTRPFFQKNPPAPRERPRAPRARRPDDQGASSPCRPLFRSRTNALQEKRARAANPLSASPAPTRGGRNSKWISCVPRVSQRPRRT